MRLRTRYFLISWPLVVLAIAAVAFGVQRWTVVELDRIESGRTPARDRVRDRVRDARWADSIVARWERNGSPPTGEELSRLAASADQRPALILLDSTHTSTATTDANARLVAPPTAAGGVARFVRRQGAGSEAQSEEMFALDGLALRSTSGRATGSLYVLPAARAGGATSIEQRGSALRRRIWSVAAVACIAAAAAALLLAGPLVSRVRRLGDAASAIRNGALDTRIDDRGGDELSELAESFNAMAASLAQARAHQRKLVGDVAHELRTPLTNVVGLVEAMQDGLHRADASTLATLRAEVGLLASLVHELQELSLAESGQLRLELSDVDIVAIVRDAMAAIAPSAVGRTLDPPQSDGGVLVHADPRRLAQTVRNLLQNAITHTPEGGRITVRVEHRGDRVVLLVDDTGCGIPAEHLRHVFDRFHRVDSSRARTSGGMGLGLAVVRELVTAMGGRVWVESELGAGSRFGIELPAA